jgi:N6-adenine-specific methylase
MRIISGSLKGRRLYPPLNLPVRPTTDMARESLFNILRNRVDFSNTVVCDLFAGTGAISFEFISHGAKQVISVDENAKCIDFIKKTSTEFQVSNLMTVRNDVFIFLGRSQMKFDIVFADPPYDLYKLDLLPDLVLKSFLRPEGIFVLEHSKEHSFEQHPNFVEQRHYGKVNFTFFAI